MKSILSLITPKKLTYSITEGESLRGVIEKFKTHKYTVVPYIDKQGKYLGTLSEGDLLRYITNLPNFTLELAEHISINVVDRYRSYQALNSNATLLEAIALSLEQNFIPLIDDRGLFIGIIKRKEILAFLFEKRLDKK